MAVRFASGPPHRPHFPICNPQSGRSRATGKLELPCLYARVARCRTSWDWKAAVSGHFSFQLLRLVATAPLGHEATHPFVLFGYRTLLFVISVLAAIEGWKRGEFEVCSHFFLVQVSAALAIGLMWLSIMVNPGSRFDGFYRWYETVLFGAAFIAMAALNRTRNIQWKMCILWSVIAIDLVYLIVDLIIGTRPLTAPFVNPNYCASYLLVGFSCSLAVLLFGKDLPKQAVAGACALFLYYGITQAWSRGATITAAATFGLAILRFGKGRNFSRTLLAVAAGLVLLIGIVASPALLRKFSDRGQLDPYNYERPKIWLGTLHLIADHPLLGVGMGEFFHVSKRYSPAIEGTLARYLKRPGIAHSEYLQYAAENGLPAAVLLFSLAGYLVYLAVRRSRECPEDQLPLHEAAILCAASLGIHALVDNNWSVPVMAAGLTVFALGDVLPMRPWPLYVSWPRRLQTAALLILLLLFAQSTVIPAAGLYFNEVGHRAFVNGNLGRAETMHSLAAAIIPNHDVLLDNAGTVYFDAYMRSHDRRMLELADIYFSRAMKANPNAEDPRHHMENVLFQRFTGKGVRRPADPSSNRRTRT